MAWVPLAISAQLLAANVDLTLTDSTASVRATYRVTSTTSPISLVLIRLPDQTIADSLATGFERNDEPGLVRITVRPDSAGFLVYRYQVRGNLGRIPVPVPSVAAPRGNRAIELTVRGLAIERLDDAFPRFSLTTGGRAQATLSHVPSLIRLPTPSSWPLLRVLDLGVLALLVFSSAGWWLRYRPRLRATG